MIIVDSIIESVRSVISEGFLPEEAQVKLSYQKNVIPDPLRKVYIVINPQKITVTPYAGGYRTKSVGFRMGINIHCGETQNPKLLFEMFSRMLMAVDDSGVFSVTESGCGEVRSDSDTNSILLPAYIEFTVLT